MAVKNRTERGEIVLEYLERFKDTPSLSLARKIYNENRLIFSSIESARKRIQYYRGANGSRSREDLRTTKFLKKDMSKIKFNPYELPESSAEERKPYKLPKANNNILLISDLHIPYHDVPAITAALDYGKTNKINTIVINGDLLDFCQISRFEKNLRKRSVKYEFDTARDIIAKIREVFPKAGIYWLKGNHDTRYEQYLMTKAPEIFDIPDFQLDIVMRLNEFNITLIDDKTIVKAGKLNIHHGHHIVKGVFAPVNAARGAFIKSKKSLIIGHCHQVSEHTEPDLDGDIVTTWSQGCLCELRPDYSPMANKYAHGFAHVMIDDKGNFSVRNMRVHNGKLLNA